MKLKYHCPAIEMWRCSMQVFVATVDAAVHAFTIYFATNSTETNPDFKILESFWDCVLSTIEACLYPSSLAVNQPPESVALSADEKKDDERLELQLIALMRNYLSPSETVKDEASGSRSIIPMSRIQRCIALLQRGATSATLTSGTQHPVSPTSPTSPTAMTAKREAPQPVARDDLSQACFAALLDPKIAHSSEAQALALNSLLEGCTTTLRAFATDFLRDPFKLTEPRIAEVRVVLRTIQTLLESTHRARAIQLYPLLVECVVVSHEDIRVQLRDVLQRFMMFFPSTTDHIL